jgi:hypothetical protein
MRLGHRLEPLPHSGLDALAKLDRIAEPKPEPGSFTQPACLANTACRIRVHEHDRRIGG